jgi:hypothetical protein
MVIPIHLDLRDAFVAVEERRQRRDPRGAADKNPLRRGKGVGNGVEFMPPA